MHSPPPGSGARSWEPTSEAVAQLIRKGTEKLVENPGPLFEQLDAAAIGVSQAIVEIEPRLADTIRVAIRANFSHWATSNYRSPGAPVAANLSAETADPELLRELLQVVSRSVFAYVDDTVAALYELISRERSQLTDATHVARMEVVALILEGAPISGRKASDRLRYELDRSHTAAIVWSDQERIDAAFLEQVADSLARATGAPRPLRLLVSPSTMWVWASGGDRLDLSSVQNALSSSPGVRVAIGGTDSGLNGFRRSHLDAVVTQRLMRRLSATVAVATYAEVEVVALATQDQDRAAEFVARTLGELASAPAELRETLRVYLREGSSATQAARAMFAHRNTVLGRLERARDLLPEPLEGRLLQVALALEIEKVFGH